MRRSADPSGFRRWHEVGDNEAPPADVRIVTSDGRSIHAHYSILASASPVLDRLLNRAHKNGNSEWIIHILGVRHGAALAFVQFLYSSSRSVLASREAEAALAEHGMALLALAHAYRVQWLKRGCEAGVAARLMTTNVVDVLKLARMCDAPSLRQRCMKLVAKDFTDVQRSEGWRFAQQHDPRLEMEIIQFLEEVDQKERKLYALVLKHAKGCNSSSITMPLATRNLPQEVAQLARKQEICFAYIPSFVINPNLAKSLSASISK